MSQTATMTATSTAQDSSASSHPHARVYPDMSSTNMPRPANPRAFSDIGTIIRDTPVLDILDKGPYGDFRDDLARDGFCVVKNVFSQEKCNKIMGQMHEWLESFGMGYNRHDPSTRREECLPIIHQKGLIPAYGAPHEQFTWEVRQDPDLVGVMQKLFNTEDLIVSFDAVNITMAGRKDLPPIGAWPHQDQDPDRPGTRCIQGFLNFIESGPDDGGLIVLKGGHKVSKAYHDRMRGQEYRQFQHTNEVYAFIQEGVDMLRDEFGYGEWLKVCAGPGDLILWDSQTPHYNANLVGNRDRMGIYVCYYPAHLCTQEELVRKRQLFLNQKGHSHWPMGLQPYVEEYLWPKRNGVRDPVNTWKPRKAPELSELGYKLTGIPYINAAA